MWSDFIKRFGNFEEPSTKFELGKDLQEKL